VLLAMAVSQGDLGLAEQRAPALLDSNPLVQPLLEPIALQLKEALQACQAPGEAQAALACFNQVLEMVKASGDL